jgi:hypothetical protein
MADFRCVRDFVLRMRFSAGRVGDIDVGAELHAEVFEALRDLACSLQFRVMTDRGAIVWPDSADFDPESHCEWGGRRVALRNLFPDYTSHHRDVYTKKTRIGVYFVA